MGSETCTPLRDILISSHGRFHSGLQGSWSLMTQLERYSVNHTCTPESLFPGIESTDPSGCGWYWASCSSPHPADISSFGQSPWRRHGWAHSLVDRHSPSFSSAPRSHTGNIPVTCKGVPTRLDTARGRKNRPKLPCVWFYPTVCAPVNMDLQPCNFLSFFLCTQLQWIYKSRGSSLYSREGIDPSNRRCAEPPIIV